MKNPWVAAFLNFFISGLGYIYSGRRTLFGVLLVASELILLVWILRASDDIRPYFSDIWMIVAGLIASVAFAVDVYREVKEA